MSHRTSQVFSGRFGPEHGPRLGILRNGPTLALVFGGFPQHGDDVVCCREYFLITLEGKNIAVVAPRATSSWPERIMSGPVLAQRPGGFLFIVSPAGTVNVASTLIVVLPPNSLFSRSAR